MNRVYIVFCYDDCDYQPIVSKVFSSEKNAKIYAESSEKDPENEYYRYYVREYEVEE